MATWKWKPVKFTSRPTGLLAAMLMAGTLLLTLMCPVSAAATDKVRLQLKWQHQFQFAGYYAAQAKGYYQAAGLDVEINPSRPGEDSVQQVLRGSAEFGVGTTDLLLLRKQGAPVVVLAVIFQHSPLALMTLKQDGVQSIHDLAGGRIMIEPGSSELYAYLNKAGIPADRFASLPHGSQAKNDLLAGVVDAMSTYVTDEPFELTQAGREYLLYSPRAEGIDFYGDNLFTTENQLRCRPKMVKAFREASLKGWEYAMRHQEELVQLIHSRYGQHHSIEHLRYEARQMVPLLQTSLVEIGHMNAGRWRRISETYAELGLMKADCDLEGFLYDPNPPPANSRWLYGGLAIALILVLAAGLIAARFSRLSITLQNDIAERMKVEAALRVERANLRAILASSPVGMVLYDEDTRIVDANTVLAGMVAKTRDWILSQRGGAALGCVHSVENERGCGFGLACPQCSFRNAIAGVLDSGMSVRGTQIQPSLMIDGRQQHPWLSISAEPVLVNGRKHVLVAIDDITARIAMEEELRTAARTDALTGLPNRALLCDRLQQAILRSRRLSGYQFAVLFLDFDRFKTINDSLGHDVGDLLLQEIGRRLQATVRAGDSLCQETREHTTARLGGDEFVILLDGIATAQDAAIVADRLLDVFAQPCQLGSHTVHSTASIGIVTSDMPAETAADVLRDADTAMYEAKLAGKGQYMVFNVAMRQRVQNRLNLENDLRVALAAGQLFVMYQPIVSLRSGRIESFEALIRWKHPVRGMVSPGEFIPIAEDTGLILPIGEWVLREACEHFARWRGSMGDAAPRSISVNLSRRQLALPDLPQTIRRIVEQAGMPPGCLHLEVTESAVMKNAAVATQMLHAIKAIGVKLDMDDFGTGYSSLACLHDFPLDVLKIDRSFIINIDRGRDFAALVQAVTQLARNLNISVIAEGIETVEQLHALQSLDCEFGQGYLFSKPLPVDQVPTFRVQSCVLPSAAA